MIRVLQYLLQLVEERQQLGDALLQLFDLRELLTVARTGYPLRFSLLLLMCIDLDSYDDKNCNRCDSCG